MNKVMIISTKGKYGFRDIINYVAANSNNLLLFVLFLCGLILGTTLSYVLSDSQLYLIDLLISSENGLIIFIKSSILYSSVYLVLFVFGLCSVGIPFIFLTISLCGAYYSSVFTIYYLNPEIYSIFQFLIMKLPSAIIFVITVFLASEAAMQMIACINCSIANYKNNAVNLKNYIIKFMILQFFGISASVIDVAVFHIYKIIST